MGARRDELTAHDQKVIDAALRRGSGVITTHGMRCALSGSVDAAAKQRGVTLRRFMELVEADEPTSMASLLEHCLIGETYFFREPEQLEALAAEIAGQTGDLPVRIWCAACATGEEAYSLAICLLEAGLKPEQVSILGTDLSTRSVKHAQAAHYQAWSVRNQRPDLVARYLQKRGSTWTVRPDVRAMVGFQQHNLFSGPPHGAPFRGVVCRNVLIYFEPSAAADVLRDLYVALAENGALLVSVTELPFASGLPLQRHASGAALLIKRKHTPGGQSKAGPRRPRAASGHGTPARSAAPRTRSAAGSTAGAPASRRPASADRRAAHAEARPHAPKPRRAPPAPATRLEAAVEAARNGAVEEAEREGLAAAAEEMLPEGFLLVAMLREARGDLLGATEALRSALYLDRTMAVAYAELAKLMGRLGVRAEAERARRNALHALEDVEDSVVLRGIERMTAGALRRALSGGTK